MICVGIWMLHVSWMYFSLGKAYGRSVVTRCSSMLSMTLI